MSAADPNTLTQQILGGNVKPNEVGKELAAAGLTAAAIAAALKGRAGSDTPGEPVPTPTRDDTDALAAAVGVLHGANRHDPSQATPANSHASLDAGIPAWVNEERRPEH